MGHWVSLNTSMSKVCNEHVEVASYFRAYSDLGTPV